MTIRTDFKNILGMTQDEIANLLGVTRSQLSMCELGKRDLPLAAKEKLAAVLTGLQTNQSSSEFSNLIKETQKKKLYEWHLKEFKTHEFKVLHLERKLLKANEMRKKAFKALEVVTYLETQADNNRLQSLAQSIKNRATTTLNKYSLQHLESLALKKEAHQMLKLQLQKKLNI